MSKPIFISYRRADCTSEAGRLYGSIIKELGEEVVFMDTSSIELGTQWTQEIENALQSAQVVIVVIGPNWLRIIDEWGMRRIDQENDWVRREIEVTLNSDKKLLPMGASQSCKSRDKTPFKALNYRRFDNYAFILIAKLGCTPYPF